MQLSTISLALTRLGGAFDPSSLFAGGTVAGAWYDPSDLSTMFTTDAGTTPVAMPGGGAAVSVGRMLDKSGNGNHAIAFNNTTARPELRARVNLLTRSEEFNNAAWTKGNVTVTANAAVAPDGTTTADLMYPNTSGTFRWVYQTTSMVVAIWTRSVYAKAQNKSILYIDPTGGGTAFAYFNLSNGTVGTVTAGYTASIQSVGSGWYRCTLTNNSVESSTFGGVYGVADANGSPSVTANGTDGIFIWGAQLIQTNEFPANTYQRIADANTYDTSGFPLYLRFDGIDDSMYTPANLNLSGTDKVAVFAGVRKLSDLVAVYGELSNSVNSNVGSFMLLSGTNNVTGFEFTSRGTSGPALGTTGRFAINAPVTAVVTNLGDIAAPLASIRVNGVVGTNGTSSQGSGNYGTYPLYIGARNNSSVWFNGQVYSLIIAGSAVSAGNISATEQWVAGKTGIVIP